MPAETSCIIDGVLTIPNVEDPGCPSMSTYAPSGTEYAKITPVGVLSPCVINILDRFNCLHFLRNQALKHGHDTP